METLKGFIVDGPHEGQFLKMQEYADKVQIPIDETCFLSPMDMDKVQGGIDSETFIEYYALGRDEGMVYYAMCKKHAEDLV